MNSKIKQPQQARKAEASSTDMMGKSMDSGKKLYGMMFEVFGRVQGVYFRKHTQMKAKHLGLNGWCMNTQEGTVKGLIEGPLDQISEMRLWLQNKGSPRSIIEKAVFTTNEPISDYNFNKFSIRR